MKITVIAKTCETNNKTYDNINDAATIFAGKNAGICYMPNDYTSDGINDEESCLKRAKFNIKSGHYSVYEHYHITFLLEEIPKMMAMILNSTGLYNTSEKSARYTRMRPGTVIEEVLYNKWNDKFKSIITDKHPELTEVEVSKLAQENARYLLSVFTPTTMSFTVPYNRALLLIDWLKDFKLWVNTFSDRWICEGRHPEYSKGISNKLIVSIDDFLDKFSKALDLESIDDAPLTDHKKMGITLFHNYNMSTGTDVFIHEAPEEMCGEYFNIIYSTTYSVSLACLAQLQRHRTIHYNIEFPNDCGEVPCYIPDIIFPNETLTDEWVEDFNNLLKTNILPQGYMVNVVETGHFLDFYAKCKERLCTRAQLEVRENTRETLELFLGHPFTYSNLVEDMFYYDKDTDSYKVKPRCQFTGYTCKEPCKRYCKDCLYSLDI